VNGEFYMNGFSVLTISRATADHLFEVVQDEAFLPVSDIFDVYASKTVNTKSGVAIEPEFNVKVREALSPFWKDIKHPDIWGDGVNGDFKKVNPFVKYPEVLSDFWDEFAKDHFKWFAQTWGPFDHKYLLAHQYSSGQSLGFHHDLSDSTILNCIGYLGDSDYTEEDGGYLEVAECDVDSSGLPMPETVKPLRRILPNHGTIVVMDNTNPRLLHRVEPLKRKKRRFTLSCQFGYLRNILTKKTNKA
jgi:hypothetical protein